MSKAANLSPADPSSSSRSPRARAVKPFAGLIDAVLVEGPVAFPFDGSVVRAEALAGWTWVVRDLCPDLISADSVEREGLQPADIDTVMPEVLARMREGYMAATGGFENGRRLRAQLGSQEAYDHMPVLLNALRCRALLGKAQAFGKATNSITDDAALGVALQSMPLQDPRVAALLFHAAMGQVTNPSRLVTTLVRKAGGGTEAIISRSGFSPLIDAILAHAQNQLPVLQPIGAFADIDLTCRGLDRFHRLVRSLTGYVEFERGSRWTMILAGLTRQVSERIEPRLKDVVSDMNQALRKAREGADRLDNDRLLAALNGVYLLATIRECRDSLALNAEFDLAWAQSGQALELHLQRNLEMLRQNPSDPVVGTRVEVGIKMAEVRFNPEYADTLRRARAAAERRN